MSKHIYLSNPNILFEDDEVAIHQGHRLRHSPSRHKKDFNKSDDNEKKKAEERILQSANRGLQSLHDTEQTGIVAANELQCQGESIRNTNRRLDEIKSNLNRSDKKIKNIKSIFFGFSKYFPKKFQKDITDKATVVTKPRLRRSDSLRKSLSLPELNVNESSFALQHGFSSQTREFNSNDTLDKELNYIFGEMSNKIVNLKQIGNDMSTEIKIQNELLDSVTVKIIDSNIEIVKQNNEIEKIIRE